MNYIATRDGVELLDENADSIYMRYIATRPRAEKHGEHGLFGAEDAVDLEKATQELQTHEGNVWTIIYSLRREDAARLGYDNAASWRALLRSKQADFAEAMQIPPSQLRWYAAFHDEGDHQHIHMMLWSDDPKYGFLRKDKLLHLQSVLTNMIYADELKEVYVQKDIAYKDVTEAARAAMRRIVDQLETVENPPESIRQKLMELALELRTVGGKKQYGYLKKPKLLIIAGSLALPEQIWKKEIIFITHIIPCKIGNAIQPRKGIIRTNTDRIETTVILRACLIWNIVYFDE